MKETLTGAKITKHDLSALSKKELAKMGLSHLKGIGKDGLSSYLDVYNNVYETSLKKGIDKEHAEEIARNKAMKSAGLSALLSSTNINRGNLPAEAAKNLANENIRQKITGSK